MPRKKKGGNRGESPEKLSSFSVGQGDSGTPIEGVHSHYNPPPLPCQASWVDVARQGISSGHISLQSSDQDNLHRQVQDMFPKIDGEVVYMVLSESNWKVDEAVEKLVQIGPESDGEVDPVPHPSRHFQGSSPGINIPPPNVYDNASLRSRLPSGNTTDISCQLPILSPKTPGTVGTNYPDSFSASTQQHIQPGMKALNSYAMNYGPPFTVVNNTNFNPTQSSMPLSTQSQIAAQNIYNSFGGIVPNYPPPPINNVATNISPEVMYPNSNYVSAGNNPVLIKSRHISNENNSMQGPLVQNNKGFEPSEKVQVNTTVTRFEQDVTHKESTKMGITQNEQKIIAKKRGRKTTMSLNPEEREALENLIEDVIIGGIGEGVMDSGESSSSSSESDEEFKLQTETSSSDVPRDDEFVKVADQKSESVTTPTKKDNQKLKSTKDKQKGFEQGQKVYPPQLKVAVKHMKNLPPRFLRKIQTNKDDKPESEVAGQKTVREKPIPEVVEPKEIKPEIKKREEQQISIKERDKAIRSKEERMMENKKKVRGMLLEGLDHYLEQSVDSDEKKQSEDPASDKDIPRTSIKNEILSDNFSHSAPSSAQVSPNARSNVTPHKGSIDLSPVDPAIKAHGPTITPQIRPSMPVPPTIMQQPRFMGHSSPGMIVNRPPAPVYIQSTAVNCEELEREMFKVGDEQHKSVSQINNLSPANVQQNLQHLSLASFTKGSALLANHQYQLQSQLQHMQNKSQFSVDAPEFVPRAFTPGASPSGQVTPHCIPQEIMPPQQIPQTMPIHVSKPIQPVGRLSPQVAPVVSTMAGAVLTQPQDQLVSAAHGPPPAVGRNSPIPGGPAFILPKVPQNVQSPHTAVPPPGAPGVGLVYAPVATPYAQFRPAGYPQYQLQGPFLVQAWPGGRKPHTNQLHPSHPASHQKTSGMGLRSRSVPTQKGNVVHSHTGTIQKMPHRGQHEMSPQQAKEKVDTLMKQGKKVLVILRGLPGSGKSTIAKEIKGNGQILTTDDFFSENGVYEHDYNRLGEAHEWNQRRAKDAIEKACNPIIIDNTNTQFWEMKPYVALALKYDYHIEIIEPNTAWKFKIKDLVQKNTHSVPIETLQKMFDRYEKHVTIERIMGQHDKKKEDGDNHVEDGDGEKRTPRRRRRRRRRRKKKVAVDANSDSDKAEDERSSDEEHMPAKQDMMMSFIVSTDTTENELERNVDNTDTTKLMGATQKLFKQPGKGLSSSLESDDMNPIIITTCRNGVTDDIIEEDIVGTQDRITPTNDLQVEAKSLETVASVKSGNEEEILEEEGNVKEKKIIDQVKSVLKAELGKFIKEQLMDTLVNEEIDKLENVTIDSSLNGNGITVGKSLARQISEKLISEHDSNIWFDEEKAKEEWEFINIEQEELEEQSIHENNMIREDLEVTGIAIEPDSSSQSGNINYDAIKNGNVNLEQKRSESNNLEVSNVEIDDHLSHKLITNSEEVEKKYWEGPVQKTDRYSVGVQKEVAETCSFPEIESPKEEIVLQDIPENHNTGEEELQPKEQRSPKKREKDEDESDLWTVGTCDSNQAEYASQTNDTKELFQEFKQLNSAIYVDSCKSSNLSTSDWTFPAFEVGHSKTAELIHSHDLTSNEIQHCNAETNTLASDFSTVQKLLQGSLDPELLKTLNLKTAVVRVINNYESCKIEENKEGSPSRRVTKLTLEKGCMTDDVEEVKEGLSFLQACFPDVPEEDLEDILSTCNQNTEWAINILLDSGYELQSDNSMYNSGDTKIVKSVDNNVESTDVLCDHGDGSLISENNELINVESEHVHSCLSKTGNEATGKVTPFPLFDLCYALLETEIKPVNKSLVVEQLSNASIQRLQIIDDFSKRYTNSVMCNDQVEHQSEDHDSSLDTSICVKDAIDEISETVFPNIKKSASVNVDKQPLDSSVCFDLQVNGDNRDLNENTMNIPNADSGDLTLHLSKDLALELIKQFGPVGFHISPESLSKYDLQVRLNKKTAKQIHQRWALTLQEKFAIEEAAIQKMMIEDEELARRLQAEEDHAFAYNLANFKDCDKSDVTQSLSVSPKRPPPVVGLGGGFHSNGSTVNSKWVGLHQSQSLKEIMEEEFAIEMSKKEYQMRNSTDYENSLSTKLKRQKLHEKFPSIDTSALDEIFKANGYSLEASVRVIEATLNEMKPLQYSFKELRNCDQKLIETTMKENREQEWLGVDDEIDGNSGSKIYQSVDDPSYQNYRTEASLHYRLRHECFEKAHEAYKRGMKAVASFYSQQGHLHTEKLKQANKRAAEKIIEYRNECQLRQKNAVSECCNRSGQTQSWRTGTDQTSSGGLPEKE